MRLLKTSGGMTHGRGITDSSLMKWVHASPHTIPICDALEKFTGTHATTSDQHKDLRVSNAARDSQDCEVFQNLLRDHSPFAHSDRDSLVSVATGTVADETVNCDNAYTIGLQAAATVVDKSYTDIKLSRKDRVISISGSKDKVTVRGQEAVINPTLLFMRISCTMKDPSEMEQYMDYELSASPPSLFDSGGMRKTEKSVLGAVLKSSTGHFSEPPENAKFVIDGGHLLYVVVWPTDATYQDVCEAYVTYALRHYNNDSIVVFDGYEGPPSTKNAKRQRCAKQPTFSDILFEYKMKTTTSQKSFLQNQKNKSRLITYLTPELQNCDIQVKQHHADADPLVIKTALSTLSRIVP